MECGVAKREPSRLPERPHRLHQHPAGRPQHTGDPDKSRADDEADTPGPGLPRGDGDQRDADQHPDRGAQVVPSATAAFLTQEQRRPDPPHAEQRHNREQQRHQQSDQHALPHGRPRQPVGQRLARRRRGGGVSGDGQQRGTCQRHAKQAPGQPQRQHLQHVDAEDLRRARADALEHRDALELLLDEDASDTRHADAAEDQHDEADQAQVVLGPLEVLADVALGALPRTDAHKLVAEGLPQVARVGIEPRGIHAQHDLVPRPAAESEQPGLFERRAID